MEDKSHRSPEKDKPLNLKEEANYLNKAFSEDTPAHEVINRIRRFPRPIVVDFNNVIANNKLPLQPNPEAKEFLSKLLELGNVFIITTARDWNFVHQFLEENDLWDQEMVLMVSSNYSFITQHEEHSAHGNSLRTEYLTDAKRLEWNFTEEDLIAPPAHKRVAPIFSKPWEVPIIDDSSYATSHNPGMLGILVKMWKPDLPEWLKEDNETKHSLNEAVEIVRKHYSQINDS